ncbi:MAG: sigma-70 family RNA polymerase sigma factor [Thermoleophilia bacterium]
MHDPDHSAPDEDRRVVARLRSGDEHAFRSLVEALHPAMLRLAAEFVPTPAVAEEVVQEAWLGVLRGIDAFEGRASLRTWVLRIVANIARTRGARERRTLPFSAIAQAEAAAAEPAVSPDRFLPAGHRWAGHWADGPRAFAMPEALLLGGETVTLIRRAIDRLPPAQRTVITLRDVEGWSSREVCELLDISEVNQRVLLHRARSRVRAVLERHLGDG